MRIRIATRGSLLAVWQAEFVADRLRADGDVNVEIVKISTQGDRDTTSALSEIGGKGVFVKEVQQALLDGRADVAVHSAKDLPAVTPDGLCIAAVPERGDARDALVGSRLVDLAEGATVATGSARRRVQLAALRPDLKFEELRGNIGTRLSKIPERGAIVMAAVALERLGIKPDISESLAVNQMIPQVGQGALAIEVRQDRPDLVTMLTPLNHGPSHRIVSAERAFLERLGGDCDLPAGAHCRIGSNNQLRMTGVLGSDESSSIERRSVEGVDAVALGYQLADELSAGSL